MAEFSKLVITNKGQALLAKMIAGSGNIEFTKVSASSTVYTDTQLEELTSLSDVKQTSLISKVTRTNEVAIKVEVAFTNTELTEGYHMKALGLYANDPDDGEILYAVTRETSGNCYMPAYNGITVSGAYVQLVTTVGNAENVSLEVNQAAVATIKDIQDLQSKITTAEQNIEELQTKQFKILSGTIYNLLGEDGFEAIVIEVPTDKVYISDLKTITELSGIIGSVVSQNAGGTNDEKITITAYNNFEEFDTQFAKYLISRNIRVPQGTILVYKANYRHNLIYNLIPQNRYTIGIAAGSDDDGTTRSVRVIEGV